MKKKNIITVCLALLTMTLVSSCSNDEGGGEFLNHQTKFVEVKNLTSKNVDKSEIPEGAFVFTVKNTQELKELEKSMSKKKIMFVFKSVEEDKEVQSNEFSLKSLERMADPDAGSTSGWYVLVKASLIYYGAKDPITVSSTACIVGKSEYTLKSWTQTYSYANWTNSFTAIDYYVRGKAVLKYYVYNEETKLYDEKLKEATYETSGTEYI